MIICLILRLITYFNFKNLYLINIFANNSGREAKKRIRGFSREYVSVYSIYKDMDS